MAVTATTIPRPSCASGPTTCRRRCGDGSTCTRARPRRCWTTTAAAAGCARCRASGPWTRCTGRWSRRWECRSGVVARTVFLRGKEEIEAIRAAAMLVARTLGRLGSEVRPGVTTATLDRLAEAVIRDHGGRPAFKGYRGFPASICASINDEVVHGIPGPRRLAEGDIVGIDVGVEMDGFYGDSAITFPVGRVSDEATRLLQVTREALARGVAQAKAGDRVGDISHAVQSYVEGQGFAVVRSLVGHGIGRQMHEEPQGPNYGTP